VTTYHSRVILPCCLPEILGSNAIIGVWQQLCLAFVSCSPGRPEIQKFDQGEIGAGDPGEDGADKIGVMSLMKIPLDVPKSRQYVLAYLDVCRDHLRVCCTLHSKEYGLVEQSTSQ